jgi:outer membrane protein OmpU
VSAAATFDNGFEATIQYSDWSDVGGTAGSDDSHIGVGVGYGFDAFTIHANYGEFDSGDSGYGLAAAYDFGGGLSANFGYGYSDNATGDDTSDWSFGLSMAF